MDKIYILMPAHNRRAVTERLVDSLVAQTYSSYHLILIDDGSTDDTAEMVQAKVSNVTVIKGKGNWWWAGSLQQGINWLKDNNVAEDEIIMFVNDDITFEPDFLKNAHSLLQNLNSTLLLPYLRNDKTGLPEETGLKCDWESFSFKQAPSPDQIDCLSTRGLFMRMKDLKRIGNFHTWLLPHYWSDYEFTIRAHKIGLKLSTNPNLIISLDRDQTGYREFETLGFTMFLRRYFSKKSVFNPFYQTSFIMMVTPLNYIPKTLLKVWRSSLVQLASKFKKTLKISRERFKLSRKVRQSGDNVKIIVGSASTKQDNWISTNYPVLDLSDGRSFAAFLVYGSVSNYLAEHVWEHLSQADSAKACKNCFAYLKQGGNLRIAVPDGFHSDTDYIAQVKPGGYGPGADDHKTLYNYRTLSELLENAGFKVTLLEWFDEQGNFHHVNWGNKAGFIMRSTRFDPRNRDNPIAYTSLIIDAIKP